VGSDYATGGAKTQAEATVLNAEVGRAGGRGSVGSASDPPSASAVEAARLQVAQAEAQLATLRSTPTAEDIAVAEAQVAQSQIAVDLARHSLENADIVAPADGELATWDLYVGDTVGMTQSVGTIIDSSGYHIDLQIDELAIASLAEGRTLASLWMPSPAPR
jgi:multidrug resistance efflux pump